MKKRTGEVHHDTSVFTNHVQSFVLNQCSLGVVTCKFEIKTLCLDLGGFAATSHNLKCHMNEIYSGSLKMGNFPVCQCIMFGNLMTNISHFPACHGLPCPSQRTATAVFIATRCRLPTGHDQRRVAMSLQVHGAKVRITIDGDP